MLQAHPTALQRHGSPDRAGRAEAACLTEAILVTSAAGPHAPDFSLWPPEWTEVMLWGREGLCGSLLDNN